MERLPSEPSADEPVCAMVTDGSVRSLDLKVGAEVWAMFKAFSVIMALD